jgi:hypothetical protein
MFKSLSLLLDRSFLLTTLQLLRFGFYNIRPKETKLPMSNLDIGTSDRQTQRALVSDALASVMFSSICPCERDLVQSAYNIIRSSKNLSRGTAHRFGINRFSICVLSKVLGSCKLADYTPITAPVKGYRRNSSDWLAPSKTGIQIMPVGNPILVILPAQVHFTPLMPG